MSEPRKPFSFSLPKSPGLAPPPVDTTTPSSPLGGRRRGGTLSALSPRPKADSLSQTTFDIDYSAVLKLLSADDPNLTKVENFVSYYLADSHLEDFTEPLQKNTHVTSLSFRSKHNVTSAGANAIAKGLSINKSVKSLDFCDTRIDDFGAAVLAKMLTINTTLIAVDLTFCRITDEGAERLRNAILGNNTLLKFELWPNDLSEVGRWANAAIQAKIQQNREAAEKKGIIIPAEFKKPREISVTVIRPAPSASFASEPEAPSLISAGGLEKKAVKSPGSPTLASASGPEKKSSHKGVPEKAQLAFFVCGPDMGAIVLAKFLIKDTTTTDIDISCYKITDKAVLALRDAILENNTLLSFEFCAEAVSSVDGCAAIMDIRTKIQQNRDAAAKKTIIPHTESKNRDKDKEPPRISVTTPRQSVGSASDPEPLSLSAAEGLSEAAKKTFELFSCSIIIDVTKPGQTYVVSQLPPSIKPTEEQLRRLAAAMSALHQDLTKPSPRSSPPASPADMRDSVIGSLMLPTAAAEPKIKSESGGGSATILATLQANSPGPVVAPAKAAVVAPVKATVVAPVKATVVAPVKATAVAPAKATAVAPVKATVVAPAKAAVVAPAKATVVTPAKATVVAPVKATAAAPGPLSKMFVGSPTNPGVVAAPKPPVGQATRAAHTPSGALKH